MKSFFKLLLFVFLAVIIVYIAGPTAEVPDVSIAATIQPQSVEEAVRMVEKENNRFSNIKPDNESQIVWGDSVGQKTEYVLLYLHGFSASQGEGSPTHKKLASRYGWNLYLPRLHDHGLDKENALLDFDGGLYLRDARNALQIARSLGQKVILMGCSTGATANLVLASENPDIEALLLFAPNVDLGDPSSDLLTMPWGTQIMRWISGGDFHSWPAPEAAKKYWYDSYRVESIVALKAMVQATMKEATFAKVDQPMLVNYYYKNEAAQDSVVSSKRTLEMFEQIATPRDKKRLVTNPNAQGHVLISDIFSKDIETVWKTTFSFVEDVLEIAPKQ